MNNMPTIKPHQIRILQTLLGKRFKDREARLHFVCSFIGRELPSTKNLTEDEFFVIAQHLGYHFEMHAYFNPYATNSAGATKPTQNMQISNALVNGFVVAKTPSKRASTASPPPK